jgi:hypothetical protein
VCERERVKFKIDKNKSSMSIMYGSCHMIFMAIIRCFVPVIISDGW